MESKDLKVTSLNNFVSEDKSKIVTSEHHVEHIFREFKAFFENQKFCDFDLFVGKDSVKIPSHRILLSASSSYFKEKLLKNEDSNEFKFPDINVATIRTVLEFMYTGRIEIRSSTVENILHIAKVWKINELQNICFGFLREELSAENCIGLLLFADRQEFFKLGESAFDYVCKHFEDVSKSLEFLLLDENQLEKLLLSPDILVDSETIIFNSLISWIKYNPTNREGSILKLLSTVRFQSLMPKFIIENRHSVCKTVECYELICTWLEWHLLSENRSKIKLLTPRKSNLNVGFATWDKSAQLKVKVLNSDLKEWTEKKISNIKTNKQQFSVLSINKMLIIAGGWENFKTTNNVEYLDFQTQKWNDLPPMKIPRYSMQMIELDNEIYAIGGCDNACKFISTVEKYNHSSRKWSEQAELPFKTSCSVSVLNGYLFALQQGTRSIYRYDPLKDKWEPFVPTISDCSYIAAAGEYLFAVGEKTMERYDVLNEKWLNVKAHDIPQLTCLGTTPNKNRILAAGRYGSVQEYDPENDKWESLAPLQPLCTCNAFLLV